MQDHTALGRDVDGCPHAEAGGRPEVRSGHPSKGGVAVTCGGIIIGTFTRTISSTTQSNVHVSQTRATELLY